MVGSALLTQRMLDKGNITFADAHYNDVYKTSPHALKRAVRANKGGTAPFTPPCVTSLNRDSEFTEVINVGKLVFREVTQ